VGAATLSTGQRAGLARHSREGTALAAARLGKFLRKRRWIGTTNVYGDDAAEKLKRDSKAQRQPNTRGLAEYVAASAPLHAVDGWGFIARALQATMSGDPDGARHLAYYAELRGALSLLAAQGIGVFNGPHAVVEPSGEARTVTGTGTHVMTWLALRDWMHTAEAARVVGAVVAQDDYSIADWVSEMAGGASWAAVGSRWLRDWGYDLRDALRDRNARNVASYAPTRLFNARPIDPVEVKRFVGDWWRALEPVEGAPFEALDRHLLRATLEEAFHARYGIRAADDDSKFRAQLSAARERLTGESTLSDSLGSFLTREIDPATWTVLTRARERDPPSEPCHHLQVIARATLLLRLASGCASDLLVRAGVSEQDTRFWTEAVGEDRALWLPGAPPDPLIDLWSEIEDALAELNALIDPEPTSYRRLQDSCGAALGVLATAERVAIWGAAA
jgi:hypothetical protein